MTGECQGLVGEIERMWDAHEKEISKRTDGWIEDVDRTKDLWDQIRKSFSQWAPLEVWVRVGRKSGAEFSLRVRGYEVGKIKGSSRQEQLTLLISETHKGTAKKYLDVYISDLPESSPWRGKRAEEFRKRFKASSSADGKKPRKAGMEKANVRTMNEKGVHSALLRAMDSTTMKPPCLRTYKPVKLHDAYFQMPVPISGHSGEPRFYKGNIDILARKGQGRGTHPVLWEVKRRRVDQAALQKGFRQAIIYTVTLIKVLKGTSRGPDWWNKVLRFQRAFQEFQEIDACLVMHDDNYPKIETLLKECAQQIPKTVDGVKIDPYCVTYKADSTGAIEINEHRLR